MKPTAPPPAYPDQRSTAPAAASDDAALFARMRAGDESALGALYDRWQSAVRALAYRITGDDMEADDVVEEVFWQAWRQADRYDAARGSAGTWLLTVARSRSLDRMRATRRTRAESSLEDAELASGERFATVGPDPFAAAEQSERATLVARALATLQPVQRECLELAYFGGLSQSEIAAKTGQPLGTVKTRMRLALRKLRDTLAPLGAFAP